MAPCRAASRRARSGPSGAASAHRSADATGPRRAREGPVVCSPAGDRAAHDHQVGITGKLAHMRGLARPVWHRADVAKPLLIAKLAHRRLERGVVRRRPLGKRRMTRLVHPDESCHEPQDTPVHKRFTGYATAMANTRNQNRRTRANRGGTQNRRTRANRGGSKRTNGSGAFVDTVRNAFTGITGNRGRSRSRNTRGGGGIASKASGFVSGLLDGGGSGSRGRGRRARRRR